MKTELVGIDSGIRNENIYESTKSIIEGGSWKRQRIVMLIPAGKSIPTKVYLSHCSLIFPPNNPAHRMAAIGMEVSHPDLSTWEYILTIEHDNIPQPDGIVRLVKDMQNHPQFSCIGGLYWTKGESGVPQIWGDPQDPILNFRPQAPDTNGGIVECCGTGMGFNLWRMSMFKDEKLRKPWFKTIASNEGVGTQDLYFWSDARKYGYRCAIDCSVKVGHYDDNTDICW
jgi:hypothetical protein